MLSDTTLMFITVTTTLTHMMRPRILSNMIGPSPLVSMSAS